MREKTIVPATRDHSWCPRLDGAEARRGEARRGGVVGCSVMCAACSLHPPGPWAILVG